MCGAPVPDAPLKALLPKAQVFHNSANRHLKEYHSAYHSAESFPRAIITTLSDLQVVVVLLDIAVLLHGLLRTELQRHRTKQSAAQVQIR